MPTLSPLRLATVFFTSAAVGALVAVVTVPLHAKADDYTVLRFYPRTDRLQIFLNDETGAPFHNFERLAAWLQARGERLVFAMNAGMYHADFRPVGLLVQEGEELAPLNLAEDTGNFFLKPNGVFLISRSGAAAIVDSREYAAVAEGVILATQSGPLLMRNGVIHPAFKRRSNSRYIRNAVGIAGSAVVFVITEKPVNFCELAMFMRNQLHCSDALYLDGAVSSLYSTALKRNDARAKLGPMIAITQPMER